MISLVGIRTASQWWSTLGQHSRVHFAGQLGKELEGLTESDVYDIYRHTMTIKALDIATVEVLHDTLLQKYNHGTKSKVMKNARALAAKLYAILDEQNRLKL